MGATARNPLLPSVTISAMLMRGQKALLRKDLPCAPVICFSDTNSTSPLPTGLTLGSSVSVGKPKSILAIFEMGDAGVGRAAGFSRAVTRMAYLTFHSSYTTGAFSASSLGAVHENYTWEALPQL